jgi:hypothetical protein
MAVEMALEALSRQGRKKFEESEDGKARIQKSRLFIR